LKAIPGKIKIITKTKRPIESLLAFAEKNVFHVKSVIIPGREERNEK